MFFILGCLKNLLDAKRIKTSMLIRLFIRNLAFGRLLSTAYLWTIKVRIKICPMRELALGAADQ